MRPSEVKWQIDIAGVKAFFEHEISKSYPYKSEVGWPAWLEGSSISLIPDFESGADFQPRLVFTSLNLFWRGPTTQYQARLQREQSSFINILKGDIT